MQPNAYCTSTKPLRHILTHFESRRLTNLITLKPLYCGQTDLMNFKIIYQHAIMMQTSRLYNCEIAQLAPKTFYSNCENHT